MAAIKQSIMLMASELVGWRHFINSKFKIILRGKGFKT
jgi:hypothetical protein